MQFGNKETVTNFLIAMSQNELKSIRQLEVKTLQEKREAMRLYTNMEQLFKKGGSYTRTLISSLFVLLLTQLLEASYSWRQEYLRLFPKQLKAEYCRRIYSSSI